MKTKTPRGESFVRTSLSYVEQVQLHFDELEIFRQQVNRFPKEFERYIDFKRTAQWPNSIDTDGDRGLWQFPRDPQPNPDTDATTVTASPARSRAHTGNTIVSL